MTEVSKPLYNFRHLSLEYSKDNCQSPFYLAHNSNIPEDLPTGIIIYANNTSLWSSSPKLLESSKDWDRRWSKIWSLRMVIIKHDPRRGWATFIHHQQNCHPPQGRSSQSSRFHAEQQPFSYLSLPGFPYSGIPSSESDSQVFQADITGKIPEDLVNSSSPRTIDPGHKCRPRWRWKCPGKITESLYQNRLNSRPQILILPSFKIQPPPLLIEDRPRWSPYVSFRGIRSRRESFSPRTISS